MITEIARRSTLDELADLTLAADKTLVFKHRSDEG